MILARGSVKKVFKTARVCQIRHAPLKVFLYSPRIQNHCAKSGTLVFRNELRKRVRTSHGRFVLCWERGGDRSIGEANLRKGRQPLQWKRHCRPLQWLACLMPGRRALLPLHPKSLRQTGEAGVFRNELRKRVRNLSCRRFVLCSEWGGDRSIGEANLRKGLCPFNGSAPRTLQWLACLMPTLMEVCSVV